MPQMAPYNWLYLFMMFNFIFLMTMSLLHFYKLISLNFLPTPNKKILFKFNW